MGMTFDKTRSAFDGCAEIVRANAPQFRGHLLRPKRIDPNVLGAFFGEPRDTVLYEHLLLMCEEGKKLVDDAQTEHVAGNAAASCARYEKAMRWLGFVQGALWAGPGVNINEMKKLNMPDEEKS